MDNKSDINLEEKSQETNSKKDKPFIQHPLSWIIIFVGIALLTFFVLSVTVWKDVNNLSNIIGFIGIILSYLGIAFAIYQIYQANKQIDKLASNSEATKEAIDETNKKIQNLHSVIELTINIEDIKTVQDEITESKYDWAHYRLRELQSRLFDIREHQFIKENNELRQIINDTLDEISDVIQTLQRKLNIANTSINKQVANRSLNKIFELLHTLKAKHKNISQWTNPTH